MASTGTDDLTLTPHGGGGGDSAEQQQGDGNAGGAEHPPVGQAEGGDKPKAAEWDASLLAVITKKELFRSMHFIQLGIEKLFENAGPIGRHHFASRRQTIDGKTVMLGDTTGEDRVKAVTALADQVIAGMGEAAAVNREAAISTLFTLTTELCPEAGKGAIADSTGERAPADRTVDVERNLQANRALAAAFATEAAGAEKRKREMAPEERQKRLKSWNTTLSVNGTPKPNDCPHLQQQKVLTVEIDENNSYPVNPTTQPLRMCDSDDVHKKAGKDEDIVGAETKSVLTGRNRVERWTCGIAVAAANLKDREEVYGGACAICKSVRNATNVTNMELLQSVMDTAMAEGRKAYEGEYGPSVSLGQAFQVAAQTVARQDASIGVQLTAARVTRNTGKDPKDKNAKERTTFKVKLPDGTKKPFKIVAGGNTECPVDCTRKGCKKNSMCAFNHRNLA